MAILKFLSLQEVFDRASEHLLLQRRAALLPGGGGAYRAGCGGCPIGSLINPADYSWSMEGVPVRFVNRPIADVPAYMDIGVRALKRALLRARVNVNDEDTVNLLSPLQNVHDIYGVWDWPRRLRMIAAQYALSYTGLDVPADPSPQLLFEAHLRPAGV